MRKFNSFVALVIAMFLVLAVGDISERIDDVGKSISELREEMENERVNVTATTAVKQENSYHQYIDVKFQKDGKTYSVRKDNKVKFYSDVYCTQEITEIPDFISSNVDCGKKPNGLTVYAVMTVNDEIIYSSQKPIIVEKEN